MSPNAGGGGCGFSANEYSCAHGAQMNFGDLTPDLTLLYVTYLPNCLPTYAYNEGERVEGVNGMGWGRQVQ
jgi:hypothetical protein